MTSTVRRAAAFAVVGGCSLAAPAAAGVREPALATVATAGPFLLVAGLALWLSPGSVLFELFARPGDRRDGKLYGLAGFALAAAGLSVLVVHFGMPAAVFVGSVTLLSVGNFGGHLVRAYSTGPILATAGFVAAGFLAGTAAQLGVVHWLGAATPLPVLAFLAASGALLAALLREVLFQRDDPLVMLSVALLLWLFASLSIDAGPTRVGIALAVTAGLGYLSYTLETASLPGMLTGVFLALLTLVLGDYGWFAMLVAFFGIGGLSTKFRYEAKLDRGIAEDNEGARGSGNVLANSLVALVAVLLAAASSEFDVPRLLFTVAFAGSIAAALADTLSSEVGGLYDEPRLITTFQTVEPGTDGAVTWQGEFAGLAGAGLVAALAVITVDSIELQGAVLVLLAGVAGMTVDSLLGATLEDRFLGNQGVNFLATLAAALVAGGLAVWTGTVAL